MDTKIRELTENIYKEGIEKAREEAEVILQEARDKAAKTEEEARKNAESIINEARQKAQELKNHVESEIKMTVTQSVSSLKQELASVVTMNVIEPSVKELFSDKTFLQELISSVVKGWLAKDSFDLQLILPADQQSKMEAFFKNSLAAELNKKLEISFSSNLKSGFKIGPADGSYLVSFTENDFSNFLKAYLRPKTSQLLFEEEK